MSFQYINQNIPNNYQYPPQVQNPIHQNQQFLYCEQNPYQVSFYNQNIQYPYNNPQFAPKISKDYYKTGELTSPNGEKTHVFRLKNGHEVVILPRKDKETIVETYIDTGSMNETDDVRGIQHHIEHMPFKGSSKFGDGEAFKITGAMGAETNASTDFAQVNYYISAPYMGKEELQKTLELQGDMVYNPTYDEEAIKSEKGPICSEISMINDDPSTIAFDKAIRNLFQINSTSQNLVAGSIETVQGITRDAMFKYHDTYYQPQNLHTVIVADENIDIDEIMQMVAENFAANHNFEHAQAPRKEVLTPIQSAKREDIISSKTNSTSVIMSFTGPKPTESKDFIIEKLINTYLINLSTSDFKNNLEALDGDYISTAQKVGLDRNDPYALISAIGLNPKDEQKGIDAFYDAIQKLQTTPLTDDELYATKKLLNKGLELNMIDSKATSDMIGNCLIDGSIDLYTNYREYLQSITKEDIMNFAKKYYDLNKVSMVVVHPQSVTKEDIINNYSQSKYSAQNLSFTGKKDVSTNDIKEEILPNSNTHIALNNSDSALCVFSWDLNTPPIKPKNPNIPLVLNYMFEQGREYKNSSGLEKFKELNGIGANVIINEKKIALGADCMAEDVPKALSVLNRLLYNPMLTRNDFEDAKRFVRNMLLTSQKDANSNLLDNMYPGYFPTDAQMLKSIDELKYEDVIEFYNTLIRSASSTFTATAPFNKNPGLEQTVKNALNTSTVKFQDSTPRLTPIFEANKEANIVYDTDDLNQAQIYKSYKFPLEGNIEDELKFELLNEILGASPSARLFSDLREKQNLAYSVSSNIKSFENTGILTLKIQTTTDDKDAGVESFDNVQKSLEGFKKHTDALCNELVSDEELEAAKNQLRQQITGQTQDPYVKTSLISMNMSEPYGIKRIDEYVKAIDKITKEDIKQAANFIFSHKPTVSILASPDTINSQMDYLKTQGKLEQAA